MTRGRIVLLVISLAVVVLLLGGGMMVKVGAADGRGGNTRLFMQALTRIEEFYVDPLVTDELLQGACEGMMSELDTRGAFLTPDEVREWTESKDGDLAGSGLSVLKGYGVLQVVAIQQGSPADLAGIVPGDQIRRIDGRPVQDHSLDQIWNLLRGPAGSVVRLEMVHPAKGFSREEIELQRVSPRWAAYDLRVQRAVAVLEIRDLSLLSPERLAQELGDVGSRGIETLLIDMRNVVESRTREAMTLVNLFHEGEAFELKDRAGETIEKLSSGEGDSAWKGDIAVLVNNATAGGPEAVAALLKDRLGAKVFGEPTYGLATEPGFFLLSDGSGVLLSVSAWQVSGGSGWADEGVTPDLVLHGEGRTFAERMDNQLEAAIEAIESPEEIPDGSEA
jgi:carboxyl-terminal processing protease